jgi:cob(I)alamin adenosyltransferase
MVRTERRNSASVEPSPSPIDDCTTEEGARLHHCRQIVRKW